MTSEKKLRTAYFSMEFALDHRIPNYAGGLGVLAADYMYAMADIHFSGVGVSLIYHQDRDPEKAFDPTPFMELLPVSVEVEIEHRPVKVGAYKYEVVSPVNGYSVPIYFLTTNFPENKPWDRDLTKHLYPSETYTRIAQEVILGIGGVRILRALGYRYIDNFHLNEGHAAFLTLEVLKEEHYHNDRTKKLCRFTTHTPVPAGHDYFDYPLAYRVLGDGIPWHIRDVATQDRLSMTHLAMNLSSKTNSVSEKHQEVCEKMFPGYSFENVTNGVHHIRWSSVWIQKLFDHYIPGWRQHPEYLKTAPMVLPGEALWDAHLKAKHDFISWLNSHQEFFPYDDFDTDDFFRPDVLTIGFARRFVPYKRPTLIFRNLDTLRKLGYKKLQLVFAGHCHPDDNFCISQRETLRHFAQEMRGQVQIVVIPEYNVHISKKMVTGCDVWLNNPIIPREASGTSGMKVALNGGLNLSILDGWWIEGMKRAPKAGWGFGDMRQNMNNFDQNAQDAEDLYKKLDQVIKLYYSKNREPWRERMKAAVGLLGHFNAQRCIEEYTDKMWDEIF